MARETWPRGRMERVGFARLFIQNPLLYPSNGESRSRGGHGRSLRRGRAHRPRPQMDANAGVQNFTIINATTVQPRAIWWP